MIAKLFGNVYQIPEYDRLKATDRFKSIYDGNRLRSSMVESSPLRTLFLSKLNDLDLDGKYKADLKLGEVLYYEMDLGNSSANYRLYAYDPFWRYLSLDVLPDIVDGRHGANVDRFYGKPKRIYLKTLWWYFHLSDTGDRVQTLKLLENFSTDTIVQLVERAGSGQNSGYDVELYRNIMHQFNQYYSSLPKKNDRFRALMKLNTLYVSQVDPRLYKGGLSGYVSYLLYGVGNII